MRQREVIAALLALCATCLCSAAPPPSQPKKLALLVGINRYKASTVPSLHGSVNDVENMRALLIGKFEFPPENILVIKDKDATHAKIIASIQTHLVARAQAGDIVVFHYSGHGSRMPDVSGDETDGWDETIVPYDSRQGGIFDISDDELNGLLQQLAAKTQNISVVLDSCHSGTATRALDEGGAQVRAIPDDTRTPPSPQAYAIGQRGVLDGVSDFRPLAANYVLIAGSRSDELSNEYAPDGKRVGALTNALVRALSKSEAGTTYRDIMDLVETEVNAIFPSQHPQIEGAGANNWVFSDRQSLSGIYFPLRVSQQKIIIQAGAAFGLSVGSVLDVYPPGTKIYSSGPATPQIELISVGAVESEARIIKNSQSSPLQTGARAVLRSARYGDWKLRVHFVDLPHSSALRKIKTELESDERQGILSFSESAESHIILRESGANIELRSADGSALSPTVAMEDQDVIPHVVNQVREWIKWFRLLELVNPAPGPSIQLTISGIRQGRVVAGDEIEIRVRNNSDSAIYLSVLDLATDGSITVVNRHKAKDSVAPDATYTYKGPTGLPADGRDTVKDFVKVIATRDPIDVSVFEHGAIRGLNNGKVASGSIAQFLEDYAIGRARNLPVEVGKWATTQQSILVVKAQSAAPSTPMLTASPPEQVRFVMHVDGRARADVDNLARTAEQCAREVDEPCYRVKSADASAGEIELLPASDSARGISRNNFNGIWDEAYRLRKKTGAARVEPAFEADLRNWGLGDEAARGGGGMSCDRPPSSDRSWPLKHMRVLEAWDLLRRTGRSDGEEGSSVKIGHPDTGYRRHPEIWNADERQSSVLFSQGFNFVEGNDDPFDPLDRIGILPNPGHGTKSSSVIVSPKGKQFPGGGTDDFVSGVAPGAHTVPIRVHRSVVHFDSRKLGEAIRAAAGPDRSQVKSDSQVISVSMGGLPSYSLWKAVRQARDRGIIVVAAAGNNVGLVVWPARFEETIAVAATNAECKPWRGSSRGGDVDIAAPGEAVWHAAVTEDGGHSICSSSGTTYATAHVAGTAALWLDYHRVDAQLDKFRNSAGVTDAFRATLQKTAWVPGGQVPAGVSCTTSTWDKGSYGTGIVDAAAALQEPVPITRTPGEDRLLPLFASLFGRGTPDALVQSRYRELLKVPDTESLEPYADLEGEVVMLYARDREFTQALDAITTPAQPTAVAWQRIRRILASADISGRLRARSARATE